MATLLQTITDRSTSTVGDVIETLEHHRQDPAAPGMAQQAAKGTAYALAAIALWQSMFGDAALADACRRAGANRIHAAEVAAHLGLAAA